MKEETVRGAVENLPPYIPGKQVEEVAREFGLKKVFKLASNENPLGTSPLAFEALAAEIKHSYIYPDQHHISLKEALSKKYGLPKEYFIAGNGSDEIMLMAAQTFLSAGDEAIISRHTFSMYEFVTRIMDGKPVFVELKDHRYDLEGFQKALTARTKLVFLCNPNNPTGTIFTKTELEAFIKSVPEDVILVVDEAYGEYSDSPEYPSGIDLVSSGRNIIVLRTFSKIYGLAGMRVGYGIAKPEIIKYLSMTKMPFNVGRAAQAAAAAALSDDKFVGESIKNNKEGKIFLYSELDKLKVKYQPTQANFICIDLGREADAVFTELLRQGVIIRPLSSFGLRDSIRVTIGTKEQNEAFINALKKGL